MLRSLTPARKCRVCLIAGAVVVLLVLTFLLGPWSMVRLVNLHDLETGRTSALTEPDEFDRWESKWSDPSRLSPQALRGMAAGTTHPDWSGLTSLTYTTSGGDGTPVTRTWMIDARLSLTRTADPDTGEGRFILSDAQTGECLDLSAGVTRDLFDRFIRAHSDW